MVVFEFRHRPSSHHTRSSLNEDELLSSLTYDECISAANRQFPECWLRSLACVFWTVTWQTSKSEMDAECPSQERNAIRAFAKNLWLEQHGNWSSVSVGIILGCGSISLPHPENEDLPDNIQVNTKQPKMARHSSRIIMSGSAHLIWVFRCARVIREETHTAPTITTQW